jgi:hypothetical protein
VSNSALDVWSLFDFLMPGYLGSQVGGLLLWLECAVALIIIMYAKQRQPRGVHRKQRPKRSAHHTQYLGVPVAVLTRV